MDRNELRYHEAAARQGLSLWRRGEDSWTLDAAPSTEPLVPGKGIEPSLTFVSDDRVRLADGRIFKRTETIRHLDELGIAHVGAGRDDATARAPAWFDVAGRRVALFGYDAVHAADNATASRAGSVGLAAARYRADITAARDAGADVIVVLPHWGIEYSDAPTSGQRAHADALTAAGTTLILGSHSHWAGAMELIEERPVLYSLGNLIFDLTRSEETVEGLIVEITFEGARPTQVRLHPTVMVDLVQPNLLEVAGDGAVVIKRMRLASEALPGR